VQLLGMGTLQYVLLITDAHLTRSTSLYCGFGFVHLQCGTYFEYWRKFDQMLPVILWVSAEVESKRIG